MHKHAHQAAHHGHAHDQGLRALFGYLRLLPYMWRSEVSREAVRAIAPRAGERVVDLGSGMGAASVIAAEVGATVLAVDPTPYMRRILSIRRLGQRHPRSITIAEGAAESIPVGDASVDALWTVNTIHHWTDRDAATRELARVLRPGGRVLLVDEDFDDPAHPHHRQSQERRARHPHEFEEVDPAVLADSLRGAGFTQATGIRTTFAGRPAKVIRATR